MAKGRSGHVEALVGVGMDAGWPCRTLAQGSTEVMNQPSAFADVVQPSRFLGAGPEPARCASHRGTVEASPFYAITPWVAMVAVWPTDASSRSPGQDGRCPVSSTTSVGRHVRWAGRTFEPGALGRHDPSGFARLAHARPQPAIEV